eukprot:GHVS01047867.1.p1 GENE.GHVS01047867.1~~GHVS01047867.1.p1  ORF type:complete len:815 (+),score=128.71 GHVS01047867.1:92-2536(+)
MDGAPFADVIVLDDDQEVLAKDDEEESKLKAELCVVEEALEDCQVQLQGLQRRLGSLQCQRTGLSQQLRALSQTRPAALLGLPLCSEGFSWSCKIRDAAKHFFNVDHFRAHQVEAMNCAMGGQDCFLVMPTGGGKSLCFQLPGLCWEGESHRLTVVVSPLLSLMSDQVMGLRAVGVKADMLSGIGREESDRVRKEMKRLEHTTEQGNSGTKKRKSGGEDFVEDFVRFVYVTPERIKKSKQFMNSLEKIHQSGHLGLLVVDEAHCISQWGHSFRPDYQHLSILKQHFPTIPIMALTATATPHVVRDVQEALGIAGCHCFRSHTNRPNLCYLVTHKPKQLGDAVGVVFRFISMFPAFSAGIVYCHSKRDAETVAEQLAQRGIATAHYHGDVEGGDREDVHRRWSIGEVQVVVATVAFGMGINRADVRFVIHFSISKSLDNFYQEAGRAGRDGKPAWCLVLYRGSDIGRHSIGLYWEKTGLPLLYKMGKFAASVGCRRKLLCQHFGDLPVACEGMCDCCVIRQPTCQQRGPDDNGESARGGGSEGLNNTSAPKGAAKGKKRPMLKKAGIPIHQAIDQVDVVVLGKAVRSVLEILTTLVGSDTKHTLTQLQEKWKKSIAEKHFGTLALPTDPDTLQQVLVNLLTEGYLKEEFFHTAFSTNSYLQLGTHGKALLRRLKVDAVDLPNVSALVGGCPGLLPDEDFLEEALALTSAGLAAGQKHCKNEQDGGKKNPLVKNIRRGLFRLRTQISEGKGLHGHCVLSVQEIEDICASTCASQKVFCVGDLKQVLCGAKVELYGGDICAACNAVSSPIDLSQIDA